MTVFFTVKIKCLLCALVTVPVTYVNNQCDEMNALSFSEGGEEDLGVSLCLRAA